MSRAATRQAIATALSTVTGVTGYASRPDVLSEGDGWPQWAGEVYPGTQQWNVLVVLPADDVSADSWVDEHGDAVHDALKSIIFIDETKPAKIATDAGDMYGVLFTGRSE